ncbi:MAG: response regulator transcription factor [Gammaproteobacteria bacterium]|nr:response regulator transcription factor [Gammaproteobacteria bacterium]
MRILLIEDDEPLALGLKHSLNREGHVVDWVATGNKAMQGATTADIELAILDLGLPDIDGLKVLRFIKQSASVIPVIILTARDSVESKVTGLDLGADDYLAKPFEMAELLARIRVLERRQSNQLSNQITVANVTIDLKAHTVKCDDADITLSRREYMIIKALMENKGRILSKTQLESKLYEWGEEVCSNTIEVHISNVRKKLPTNFITTVRGVGYIVKP